MNDPTARWIPLSFLAVCGIGFGIYFLAKPAGSARGPTYCTEVTADFLRWILANESLSADVEIVFTSEIPYRKRALREAFDFVEFVDRKEAHRRSLAGWRLRERFVITINSLEPQRFGRCVVDYDYWIAPWGGPSSRATFKGAELLSDEKYADLGR